MSASVYPSTLFGSRSLQDAITKLAAKHGLDLAAREAHLRLEQPSFMPLVIEKIGLHQVSVAHYYYQNGDAIPDPDIVLFTRYAIWVPIEISIPYGYSRYGYLNERGDEIERITSLYWQRDLASFCDTWAQSIEIQGWLESGVRA